MNKILNSIIFIIATASHTLFAPPCLPQGVNAIKFLQEHGLYRKEKNLKLHLGCGESRLPNYINIDFPSADHTVQTKTAADVFADITTLILNPQSVDEIRSHHLFEHFPRQMALALLCSWHHALKCGGTLTIETPDFEVSARMILDNSYNYTQKQTILRHIFGSHEAHWAMHYDGWYKQKFEHVLSQLGFTINSIQQHNYKIIHSITVHATKEEHLDPSELAKRAKNILRESMVDHSPTEEKIWSVWADDFDKHFATLRK